MLTPNIALRRALSLNPYSLALRSTTSSRYSLTVCRVS